MGHCGRNNIRISWIFIKITLVLSYAGQTAWLLNHVGETIGAISPFYHTVPQSIYWFALGIATLSTIIASQSLISGCFTLINEAIRLDIWPRHLVQFPGNIKGQLYIPFINWTLMFGCIGMVLYFKESTKMEAAFGLSVTLTMIMSTILIFFYLKMRRFSFIWIALITMLFLSIEFSFLMANLQKIAEGGWITLLIGSVLFMIMFIWNKGKKIKDSITKLVAIENYIPILKQLSFDENIPKFTTNLVFLTSSNSHGKIEQSVIDSILNTGTPKRADVYWFIHVNVTNEPYGLNYHVETIVKDDIYQIVFNLGFRIEPRIDYYFREVIAEMVSNKEVNLSNSKEIKYQKHAFGDFKFVVRDSFLSYDNNMPFWKNIIMKSYYNLKYLSVKEHINFGLDKSNLIVEKYPLIVIPFNENKLIRNQK